MERIENIKSIIEHSQKFNNFSKLYNKIIKSMSVECFENFELLNKFQNYYTENDREQWETIDISDEEFWVATKKINTHLTLRILNKNIFKCKKKGVKEVEKSNVIDENALILIEYDNHKNKSKCFVEIVVAKENKKIYFVEKFCNWNMQENEWDIELTPMEIEDLESEETKQI